MWKLGCGIYTHNTHKVSVTFSDVRGIVDDNIRVITYLPDIRKKK